MKTPISRTLGLALAIGVVTAQESPVTDKEVLPILEKNCFQCHGEALKMANLDLRSRASILKGGDKVLPLVV
jgi:hypothetical protein